MGINLDNGNGTHYPKGYRDQAKIIWYKAGRPSALALRDLLPPEPVSGQVPGRVTLNGWIFKEWKDWADEMDQLVESEIQGKLIQDKVQMFKQHMETAQEMQQIAMDWLRDNGDKINAIAAVRLLVDGVRIENESRGVPAVLRKMIKMTDDQLLDEVKGLLSRTPVAMETIEEISGDAEIPDSD